MPSRLRGEFMNVKKYFRTALCTSVFEVFLVILVVALGASIVAAQSTGGRIRGTVTDPTGGAIAGVKVTIINQATGAQRETETGENGEYIFLEVPVGTYEVQVNHAGFKKYIRKGVALDLNQILG